MANAFWNKHFDARLRDDFFAADGEFKLPLHNDHQLVRCMDEIIPLSAGLVGEQVAGVAPPAPVMRDLVTIERDCEFLMGVIGHESSYGDSAGDS